MRSSIKCPECYRPSIQVLDSRYAAAGNHIRRRRICKSGHRWTTDEVIRDKATAKKNKPYCPHCMTLLKPRTSSSATMSVERITCPKGHYSKTIITDLKSS